MNKLIHFYSTPTGRSKMVETITDAQVSVGATTPSNAKQWETLGLRITVNGGEAHNTYQLSTDRVTAAKVVDQLREYLDDIRS